MLGCWQNYFMTPQSRTDRFCRVVWKEICRGGWKKHLLSSSSSKHLFRDQEMKSNGDDVGRSYSTELRLPIDVPVQKSSSVIC